MKRLSNNRAKACAIPRSVKDEVWERDGHCCIWCGSPNAFPECHYIPRSRGGLGIAQNIVTGCRLCHETFDFGTLSERDEKRQKAKAYLQSIYPDWNETSLYYKNRR